MRQVGASLRAIGFVALTLPLMPLQLLLLKTGSRAARLLPQRYHRWLCRLLRIRVLVEGVVPTPHATLIIPNHVSWLDIPVLSSVMPLSFVAKREVAGWPLFGWLARLQRTVFVDRERRHSTGESADTIGTRLAAGEAIVLFAEGTSHDGNTVLPFKSSFFAAATSPDIDIVPVTLAYTHVRGLPMTRRHRPAFAWYGDVELVPHLWNVLCEGPLQVTVAFHTPLHVETGRNRKVASLAAEEAVRAGLLAALHGRRELG